MMKRVLYPWLVLLVLLSQAGSGCKDQDAPAEDSVFLKIYGTVGNDVSSALLQLDDGGFLITGSVPDTVDTTSTTEGDNDGIALIRTNALGEVMWLKTFGDYGDDRGEDMLQMTNGDVLITGYWASGPNGGTDMFVMRVTTDGDVVWTQYLQGSGYDAGYALAETDGGEYYAVGVTESTEFGASSSNVDLLVWKFDADGSGLWSSPVGFGGENEDGARSIVATSDGGLAIAGFYRYDDTDYDATLLKVTDSGDSAWTYRDSVSSSGFGYAVEKTDAGNLIVMGFAYDAERSYDLVSRTLTSSGALVPDESMDFGGADNDRYQCKRFLVQTDGSLIGAGWSQSFGEGGNDFYLFKVAEGGASKLRTYGGSNDDVPTDIIRTRNNGIAIVGHTKSFSANTDKDIVLILADENGNLLLDE